MSSRDINSFRENSIGNAFSELQTGGWLGSELSVEVKDVQNKVPPGTDITQRFIVKNNNSYIGFTDPNRCESGLHVAISGGLKAKATAYIGGEQVATEGICVGASESGLAARRKELFFDMVTPKSEGIYDFHVIFRLGGTDDKFAEYRDRIKVEKGTNKEGGNDPDETGEDYEASDFQQWALNNPMLAVGGGLAGLVAVRTAISTTISGD